MALSPEFDFVRRITGKTLLIGLVMTEKKTVKKKCKVILLHAMEAHGVRGGIAPTHS
jgi:hypothetical protein